MQPNFIEVLRKEKIALTASAQSLKHVFLQSNQSSKDIDYILQDIQEHVIRITIVGEVNRGKSTFMNAIVHHKLFPPRATVCTAVLTELRDGTPRVRLEFQNGQTSELVIPTDKISSHLSTIVSKKNPDARHLKKVQVWYPNRFATDGVVLVDTPGVNDPEIWREQVTVNALTTADAAIFLLDAHKPLTKSERNFLMANVLGNLVNKIIFVVNKCDYLTEEQRRHVYERCHTELSEYISNPNIFLVAALPALRKRIDPNKEAPESVWFESFEQFLFSYLQKERISLFFDTRKDRLRTLSSDLYQQLSFQLQALNSKQSGLTERLKQAEIDLKNLSTNLQTASKKRRKEISHLPDKMATAAQNAWTTAANSHLTSYSKVQQLLSLDDRDDIKEEIESMLAMTKRESILSVQETVQREVRYLTRSIDTNLSSLHNSITTISNSVLGDMGGQSFSQSTFSIAQSLWHESQYKYSGIDSVVGMVLSAGVGLVGLFASIFEYLSGHSQNKHSQMQSKLNQISMQHQRELVVATKRQAEQLQKTYVETIDSENKRQLATAQNNFSEIRRKLQGNKQQLDLQIQTLQNRIEQLRVIMRNLNE